MNKKQTAVEFLYEKLKFNDRRVWHTLLKEAKELEKNQIIDAFVGLDKYNYMRHFGEQYYEDTYAENND